MFSNAKRTDLSYKINILKKSVFSFTLIAALFGIICYSAGFGDNEEWIFEIQIEHKQL